MPVAAAEAERRRPHRLLESLRDAIDDLTERATPTVREVSARAAELTAIAADEGRRPLAKKAGDATAEASGKLAERSRHWADGGPGERWPAPTAAQRRRPPPPRPRPTPGRRTPADDGTGRDDRRPEQRGLR